MDNGATRTFTYKATPGFQVGDLVHVENGSLAAG
ncbi:Outer membrane lipoprotein [Ralstonia solanacearum]|nr:Outer membrane lipoprotein [Ralstonia solanacearum]